MAVLELKNLAKSLMDWNWVFSFRVPRFVSVYLSNKAEIDFDALSKVVDITQLYNFRYYRLCQNETNQEIQKVKDWCSVAFLG